MEPTQSQDPPQEVHIKVDAWTEATMCGHIVSYRMRRQWAEGKKPTCIRCLKSFLKRRGITEGQRLWAMDLLKKANGAPVS